MKVEESGFFLVKFKFFFKKTEGIRILVEQDFQVFYFTNSFQV